MKTINTVKGIIESDNLGITLVHEHVFNNYPFYKEHENTEFALQQINLLKPYNVNTIIDLTPYAKLDAYQNLIDSCNINIICAVGFYLDKLVPKSYKTASVSELVDKLSKKIEIGIGKNKYKPGIIKIAANSAALTSNQMKYFEVACILHQKYNIPIATHSPNGGLKHLNILLQMGAKPEHLYLSHLENSINIKNFEIQIQEIKTVLDKKANIVLSNFGTNNKGQRYKATIRLAKYLKQHNYLSQTLISADCNWQWKSNILKLKDCQFAGAEKNYAYVFEFIIPALKNESYTDDNINQMLVINPKKIFDYLGSC